MKEHLSLVAVILFIAVGGGLSFSANGGGNTEQSSSQEITKQLIARERASYEAWQKKDRAFWGNYLTDDSTYFGPDSPYMEVDPKVNFVPRFEQYAELFKILDFQIYNPHVQVYGDVAILTYNLAQAQSVSGRMTTSTGKVSRVYLKQGGTWRVVHTHESTNPKAQ